MIAIGSWGNRWILMVATYIKTYSWTIAAFDEKCFRLGSTLANLEQQSLLELWVETNIKTYNRTCNAHYGFGSSFWVRVRPILFPSPRLLRSSTQSDKWVEIWVEYWKRMQVGQFWVGVRPLLKMYLSTVERKQWRNNLGGNYTENSLLWVVTLLKTYFELSPF